jgi:hypothetical protein
MSLFERDTVAGYDGLVEEIPGSEQYHSMKRRMA